MKKYHRKTLTYDMYGEEYRKETDIFTNCKFWIPKYNPQIKSKNRMKLQGMKSEDKAKIPEMLCKEIVDVCETGQILTQAPSESFNSNLAIPLRSIQMSLSETLR